MTVSLKFTAEDEMLIKRYAEKNNISVSELIQQSVMDRIETEYDLECFDKAMDEYRQNPVTYSLDEIETECLG